MNRDWFRRTQPETDGKLRLLSRFPPVLYIDAHEQGPEDCFFPPNAEPIYHEISPQSVGLDQQPLRRGHGGRSSTGGGSPIR